MPVKYNVIERKNLLNKTAAPKFYATAKADGEISVKAIAKEIAKSSKVEEATVSTVLANLTKVLTKHLSDGKVVKLGDFGNFQISIGSDGAESEAKFNTSLIKTNKVQFRPGAEVKEMLKEVKYEKYSKK